MDIEVKALLLFLVKENEYIGLDLKDRINPVFKSVSM